MRAVTEVLAEGRRFDEVAPHLLETIAGALGFDAGGVWLTTPGSVLLRCRHFWIRPDDERAQSLRGISLDVDPLPGVSLAGRVQQSSAPIWVEDLERDRDWPAARAAIAAGFCSALAFPILGGRDVIGAIELFSRERHPRDAALADALPQLGSHLGLYLEREQALAALRRSEARFRALFEHSSAGVLVANAESTVLEANPSFAAMFGFDDSTALRGLASWDLLIDPHDRAPIRAELEATGIVANRRVQARRREGDAFWVLLNASFVEAEDGVRTMLGTFVDIDAERKSEESLRELARNLDEVQQLAHIGSFERDLATGAMRWSDELYRICGLAPRSVDASFELLRVHVSPGQREAAIRELEEAVRLRQPFDFRSELVREDGQRRAIRVRGDVALAVDGTPIRLFGTITDLTSNDAPPPQNAELETHAEQSRRLAGLGRLAATMAHEFNNVLMGIDSFLEVLRRHTEGEQNHNAIRHIQQSLLRGRRISDEILRFTRSSKPVKAPIDVRNWLHDFLAEAMALVAGKVMVRLDVTEDLALMGDVAQLNQVLANLVLNARDASREGQPLVIGARRSFNPPGFVDVFVTDRGSGIPEDVRERIFEPLFTTKRNGTGLGLAVAHQVVTAHGGLIRVTSEIGNGTSFHLLLPAVEYRPATPHAGLVLPRDVLLVEDDAPVATGLSQLLQLEDIRVQTVGRGGDVLLALQTQLPDVMVLDIGLPDISGIDVYAELSRRWPRLPVIFISAQYDPDLLARFLLQPHVAFLRKPFEMEQLLKALARVNGV